MKNIKKRFLIGIIGGTLTAFGLGFGVGHFSSSGDDTKNESSQETTIDETLLKEYLKEYDAERDSVQKEIENLKAEKARLEKEKEEQSSAEEVELSSEREALEKEIEELQKQKEMILNSKDYNVSDLIVVETDFNHDGRDYYILEATDEKGVYNEIHGTFKGCYIGNHPEEVTTDNIDSLERPQSKIDYEMVQHSKEYVHFYDYEPLINYLDDSEIEYIENHNGVINSMELDETLNSIRINNKKINK